MTGGMTGKGNLKGHIIIIATMLAWAMTFIATKTLLVTFSPIEILAIRFVIGYLGLWALCPRWVPFRSAKEEGTMALAGFLGITLYFLLENVALQYTQAANAGIIVSVGPVFTALVSTFFFGKKGVITRPLVIGFLLAMVGLGLVNFSSVTELQLNPKGDLLALLAALTWAFYSNVVEKTGSFGYSVFLVTRRTFFYGLLLMLPFVWGMGFDVTMAELLMPKNLGCMLFLALGASTLCFASWNYGVKMLGPVTSSLYLYMQPVFTIIASVVILHETVTRTAGIGIGLTLAGLLVSSRKGR